MYANPSTLEAEAEGFAQLQGEHVLYSDFLASLGDVLEDCLNKNNSNKTKNEVDSGTPLIFKFYFYAMKLNLLK
jgi:hypothetical protein